MNFIGFESYREKKSYDALYNIGLEPSNSYEILTL
jgi:hypothetical protein